MGRRPLGRSEIEEDCGELRDGLVGAQARVGESERIEALRGRHVRREPRHVLHRVEEGHVLEPFPRIVVDEIGDDRLVGEQICGLLDDLAHWGDGGVVDAGAALRLAHHVYRIDFLFKDAESSVPDHKEQDDGKVVIVLQIVDSADRHNDHERRRNAEQQVAQEGADACG